MVKDNHLDFRFKYPKYLSKFREPEISEASKNDERWRNEILGILTKCDIETDGLIINIRGYYSKKYQEKMDDF